MSAARGLALVVGLAVLGGATIAAVYAPPDGLITLVLLLAIGLVQLALAHAIAAHRAALGSLRRQFQVGLALAIGLSLAGIGAVALAMFVSPHDALVLGLMLVFSAALGAYSASLLAAGVLGDVRSVQGAVKAVGEGRLDVSARTTASDELAELAHAANEAASILAVREAERDAAWQAHRDLIAAVSHDLRTPLTSLRLLSEAIEDEVAGPEERTRYLGEISNQIGSLGRLVDDLFELSRLEAGDIEWTMAQVELDELVGEAVETLKPQARAKGIKLLSTVPAGTTPARANPERLQRVLFNLLQNAIRHTPTDGSVWVLAESAGDHVELEIADSGEGIDPSDRERVFEPFFRGARSRAGEGAGLGLAISRAIIEAHGGRIWLAESTSGTRVRLSLPTAG